uniref:Heparan-alpha-glucosaminide N-acetyltransferase catalytic domain-containing protein n=1 Tax=Leersia perrieri TaxID=77586 RepID=A0A0D9XQS9_9ORYZ
MASRRLVASLLLHRSAAAPRPQSTPSVAHLFNRAASYSSSTAGGGGQGFPPPGSEAAPRPGMFARAFDISQPSYGDSIMESQQPRQDYGFRRQFVLDGTNFGTTMPKTAGGERSSNFGFGNSSRYLEEHKQLLVKGKRDFVHVLLKKKKTFVTVTDVRGNKKTGASAGSLEDRKGRARLSKYAAEATAEHVGRAAKKMGIKSVVMKVKGAAFFSKKKKVILSFREGFRGERQIADTGLKSQFPTFYVCTCPLCTHGASKRLYPRYQMILECSDKAVNSDGEKGSEQHSIDVGPSDHGDGGVVAEKERLAVVEEPGKKKSKRVAALDAFRGLTIVLMILVDDAGGAYERMDHSPWNGCTLADFVMPFFLFIVGVAIAFALKRVPKLGAAVKKITIRTLKMLFWGLLLQGGYSHAPDDLAYGVDMKKIRWCGILQRIALVYFVVALIEAFTTKVRPTAVRSGPYAIFHAYRWQWLGGFIAFVIYMVTTFSLFVPDWSYVYHNDGDVNDGRKFKVQCGVRGHLDPACNAVGYVDRVVWGINHLYTQPVWIRSKDCTSSSPNTGPLRADAPAWCLGPFEPEGLLRVLNPFIILAAIPINKQLYSFSYVCFTAGAAGVVLSAFYILIDVWGLRTPFLFLEWIGMNAMLVFVLAAQAIFPAFVNGWYYDSPGNTLVSWIQKHVFINVWHSQRLGTLLYVIFGEIVFWGVVSGILHKLGIYWKL